MPDRKQSDLLIEDLRRQITSGQVVAIVGAGVSINATEGNSASWRGLLRDGVERCKAVVPDLPDGWVKQVRQDIDSKDMHRQLAAAEKISSELRRKRQYRRWLKQIVGSISVKDESVIQALENLGVPIATTNYDGLIEEVTGWQGVTWRQRSEVERILRGDEKGVLHLHGYWKYPDSVVLGIGSYRDILRDQHAQAMLRAVVALRTILFVGFGEGLADPNFDALLRWQRDVFRDSDYCHYRLALETKVAKIQSDQHRDDGIIVLSYGSDHSDLVKVLWTLAKDEAEISFEVTDELQEKNLQFSVLHVRDGKEHEEDHGSVLNRPHPLHTKDSKKYSTTIKYTKTLGFQFKCFVDYGSNNFEEVVRLLKRDDFHTISNEEEHRRAWFLLPEEEYETYTTPEGFANNFYPRT